MNKNLVELAKKHADHSVKEPVCNPQDVDLEKAFEIYENGLKDEYVFGSEVYTRDTALFGILASMLDESVNAKKAYTKIRKEAGKSKGMYYINSDGDDIASDANPAMGLLCATMGKAKEAGKIFDSLSALESNGLYGHTDYNDLKFTENNALVGSLAASIGKKKKAQSIYKKINNEIGKENGMYKHAGHLEECKPFCNAAMAVFCMSIGREKEAGSIIGALPDLADLSGEESYLVGIYHCLKAGKNFSPSKKKPKVK